MVKAYWYRGNWTDDFGNVGDIVPPYILSRIFNRQFNSCGKEEKGKLLSVGSVLCFLQDNDIVWGSGYIQPMRVEKKENVRIVSVRGPLSDKMLAGNNRYGDPCFMLPDLYFPRVKKKYDIGIVPHYVDEKIVRNKFKDIHVISAMNTVEGFINDILQCDRIISSSLHGIVISEAYGIPSKWVQYSERVIGGHFKFHDYYLGTGRQPEVNKWMELPNRSNHIHLNELINII